MPGYLAARQGFVKGPSSALKSGMALASWKRGVSDGDVAPNAGFIGCVPELASLV